MIGWLGDGSDVYVYVVYNDSMDYDELYQQLLVCSPRSRLFTTVKAAMKQRKHWKNKPRGSYATYGVSGYQVGKQRQLNDL